MIHKTKKNVTIVGRNQIDGRLDRLSRGQAQEVMSQWQKKVESPCVGMEHIWMQMC